MLDGAEHHHHHHRQQEVVGQVEAQLHRGLARAHHQRGERSDHGRQHVVAGAEEEEADDRRHLGQREGMRLAPKWTSMTLMSASAKAMATSHQDLERGGQRGVIGDEQPVEQERQRRQEGGEDPDPDSGARRSPASQERSEGFAGRRAAGWPGASPPNDGRRFTRGAAHHWYPRRWYPARSAMGLSRGKRRRRPADPRDRRRGRSACLPSVARRRGHHREPALRQLLGPGVDLGGGVEAETRSAARPALGCSARRKLSSKPASSRSTALVGGAALEAEGGLVELRHAQRIG